MFHKLIFTYTFRYYPGVIRGHPDGVVGLALRGWDGGQSDLRADASQGPQHVGQLLQCCSAAVVVTGHCSGQCEAGHRVSTDNSAALCSAAHQRRSSLRTNTHAASPPASITYVGATLSSLQCPESFTTNWTCEAWRQGRLCCVCSPLCCPPTAPPHHILHIAESWLQSRLLLRNLIQAATIIFSAMFENISIGIFIVVNLWKSQPGSTSHNFFGYVGINYFLLILPFDPK